MNGSGSSPNSNYTYLRILTNECIPIQEEWPEKIDSIYVQIVFSVLYFLVWITAISGNSIVLYIILFQQVPLTVRTIFIGNLAISDIIMCLTSLPVTAVNIFTRNWVFPDIFCNLIGIFQGGSIFVSSFTLTAIAVDRFLLIAYPNKGLLTKYRGIIIVVIIWLLGYFLSLPTGIFSMTRHYEDYCGEFCEESWPDGSYEHSTSRLQGIYGVAVITLQFGVPVVINSICYWIISRVIDRQFRKRRTQSLLKSSEHRLLNRKSRSNRMMLCMVLGLVLAWLPINLINISRDFYGVSTWFSIIFAFCHVIAMTSTIWNPVIYSWFNPQFRATLHWIIPTRKDLARPRRMRYMSTPFL